MMHGRLVTPRTLLATVFLVVFMYTARQKMVAEEGLPRMNPETSPHAKTERLQFLEEQNNSVQTTWNQKSNGRLYSGNVTRCEPIIVENITEKTPFKIFVYDLPPRFNVGPMKCAETVNHPCSHFTHCGVGAPLENRRSPSIHDSNQFSLEVVIHHHLLYSSYRTFSPDDADVFYVPFYGGLQCLCVYGANTALFNDFAAYITKQPYFHRKPHVMTLGKVEREMGSKMCPLLQYQQIQNFTFIAIEQEQKHRYFFYPRGIKKIKDLIVAPYVSNGHIKTNDLEHPISTEEKTIFLFIAASTRKTHPLRGQILDQFKMTKLSYQAYMETHKDVTSVWYETKECKHHSEHLMEWMRHSIFCLQPPGDTPTRKSFYDAILSRCIPVIFSDSIKVIYPFENVIQYKAFVVSLPGDYKQQGKTLLGMLRNVSETWIDEAQHHLQVAARILQYSYPPSNRRHHDAMKLILDEIQNRLL